ncbi:hypothetical protein B0H17DRAFT_1134129 [Mycena rosella]|uniref:Uncharacterized protein n=1 Tax=Mycena rosella TaxID=1033263 RepID=A0AAD7DI92_MYCRO|nr:hypothetical protein B0H17DRAFT_1134129 [Mycena rosella]
MEYRVHLQAQAQDNDRVIQAHGFDAFQHFARWDRQKISWDPDYVWAEQLIYGFRESNGLKIYPKTGNVNTHKDARVRGFGLADMRVRGDESAPSAMHPFKTLRSTDEGPGRIEDGQAEPPQLTRTTTSDAPRSCRLELETWKREGWEERRTKNEKDLRRGFVPSAAAAAGDE